MANLAEIKKLLQDIRRNQLDVILRMEVCSKSMTMYVLVAIIMTCKLDVFLMTHSSY